MIVVEQHDGTFTAGAHTLTGEQLSKLIDIAGPSMWVIYQDEDRKTERENGHLPDIKTLLNIQPPPAAPNRFERISMIVL